MLEGNGISGLVSVIIPTFRRSDYLERAIISAVEQTYENIEIVVVNDNEHGDEFSQRVYDIIKKYPSVVLCENDFHKNGSVARNNGLKIAKGEYIAFLDDDDYWDSGKIKKQVEALRQQADEYIACSTLKKFVRDGKVVRKTLKYRDGNVYESVLYREIEVTTSTILIKRCALEKIQGFDETLPRRQDIELFIHLFKNGKLKLIDEPLTYMEIGDSINRKFTPEKMRQVDDLFFNSIEDCLSEYPKFKKDGIIQIYKFESGVCLIGNHYYKAGIDSCLGLIKHPLLLFAQVRRKVRTKIEIHITPKEE